LWLLFLVFVNCNSVGLQNFKIFFSKSENFNAQMHRCKMRGGAVGVANSCPPLREVKSMIFRGYLAPIGGKVPLKF